MAQDIKPKSNRLIMPATIILRQKSKPKKKSLLFVGGLAAAYMAAIVIVIIGVTSLLKSFNKPSDNIPSLSYNISSLNITSSLEKAYDDNILSFDYEKMTASYNIYSYLDETVMYSTKYKVETEFGTDTILVYADIKRGLKDYTDIKNARKYSLSQDVLINIYEDFQNGEYYTYAFFADEIADYYIFIMSPEYDIGIQHIENLIKT